GREQNNGAVCQRLETQLLRQGRRLRLSLESRWECAAGPVACPRSQCADARLWRRVLANVYDRRQRRPHRDRLHEELHPARDAELRWCEPGWPLPFFGVQVSERLSSSRR